MAYDNPRPISQPVGSTQGVVAKDNLITFDSMINTTELTVTNRKGDVLTSFAGYQEKTSDIFNEAKLSAADAAQSAADAAQSAGDAENSANIATASANFVGLWGDQTGAANIPYSVYHNGNNWQLLNNLANVAASEPSAGNADWAIIVGNYEPKPAVDMPLNINEPIKALSGGLTTSRNSTSTIINNSGVIESIGIDEAQLGIDGLGSFEAFTNSVQWSEDLSGSAWVRVGNLTVSQDGTLASDGDKQAWRVAGAPEDVVVQNIAGLDLTGPPVLVYQELKAGTSSSATIRWVEYTGGTNVIKGAKLDLETGEISGAQHEFIKVTKLHSGWWAVWWANSTSNVGNTLSRVDVGSADASLTDGSIYVANVMVVGGVQAQIPYVKTEDTPVTRAADNASIPMMNNIPAPGQPFSIALDAAVPRTGGTTARRLVSRTNQSVSSFLALWREKSDDRLRFGLSSGMAIPVNAVDMDELVHRIVVVYDRTQQKVYTDGVLKSAISNSSSSYDIDTTLHLGENGVGADHLNSHIRNFKIYHRALTDAEVATLGGPQI